MDPPLNREEGQDRNTNDRAQRPVHSLIL